MYTKEKPDLEILVHSGVVGMKWGKRKGTAASNRRKKQAGNEDKKVERKLLNKEMHKMNKDQIVHPIASTHEQLKLLKSNPKKAFNLDTKTAKELNDSVDKRVAKGKTKRKATLDKGFKRLSKMLDEWADEPVDFTDISRIATEKRVKELDPDLARTMRYQRILEKYNE